jgi:hypothetical protein
LLAFKKMCREQRSTYAQAHEGTIDPEVEQDFKERLELGEGMLRYHCFKVSPRLDANLTPIRVEIEFEVPIVADQTDPDSILWCKCNNCWQLWMSSEIGIRHHDDLQTAKYHEYRIDQMGSPHGVLLPPDDWALQQFSDDRYRKAYWRGLPVTYGGRIDCLMEDEYGRWWLVDWKTAARLSGQEEGDSPDEFILLDDQITSYCWALWRLGIPIAGFIHHEMKKAFPIEPEPNKQARKGCWYSVNKQQNTSYELYLETIMEGDPAGYSSGAYQDFLDWLRAEGPRFHSRKQVARSEAELRNAGHNIYLEATEMIRPDLPLYPSPGRFGCTFCAYRQPCIGVNRDEDVSYTFQSTFIKRSPRYWEHNKPSTDSKGGQ